MNHVMGLINLWENEEQLREITGNRSIAAIPFAGRYRVIDFILSSMVNSGIQNVGILMNHKSRSLLDHLRSGKEWDLARKSGGLYILPGAAGATGKVNGDIENFYHNLDYIENSRQKYVLLSGSQTICNMNYRKILQFHENTGADITVIYNEPSQELTGNAWCTVLETTEDGRITDIALSQAKDCSGKVSMDMYVMSRELLIRLISDCYVRSGVDLLRDGIIKNLCRLKMYGFGYKGYVARIHSIHSYYQHTIELLNPQKWQELFNTSGLVYTKVKDEAPVKYNESAKVSNAMIANGCIIEGRVENSVLFRGVEVGKNAYIRDSVIMQKCKIGESAVVENVICDKDVSISDGKWLKGDTQYPLVIEKGTVI